MRIASQEYVEKDIADLKPHPRNPREGDVGSIHESIEVNGFYGAIIVQKSTGHVLAGNHRLQAAAMAGGLKVPVLEVDCDDVTAEKILLADNWTSDVATNKNDILVEILKELAAGPGLEGTGFDGDDLDELLSDLGEAPKPEADSDPMEPPKDPKSQPGEVYELGPHRLICGDSTDADTIATLMGDDRAACVWTDPPYGVAYVGKTKDALTIENDNLKPEVLEQLLRDSLGMSFTYTENGGAWYVASPGGDLFHIFGTVLRELGVWRHTLIWVKDVMVMGRADYHYQHEPIFYGWKEGASHNWYSDRKQTTILNFDRPKRSEQHPTMKPLELIEYCLRNSTKRDDIVLDPFGGSGSTLMAADRIGRIARTAELDPGYCDVIRTRYAEHANRPDLMP